MKILIIVIVILLIIIIIETFAIGDKLNWNGMFVFPLACLSAIVAIIMVITYKNEIKPIDVYRGDTTLEITYRDSIAIDSIVTWKNK
jgi:hypothetical protein